MTIARQFHIPRLATVKLDATSNAEPLLEIVLDPDYHGDLNDIARKSPGPDDVYLRCDELSAENNADLARFMEVLAHWDYTGDGVPDCDEVMAAIDDAFWRTDEQPEPFVRPQGSWYTNLVMSIVPPAPDRHIVFGFGELRPRFRGIHHLVGVLQLAVIFGLIILQDSLLPIMKYSVISGWAAVLHPLGISWWLALVLFVVAFNLLKRRNVRRKVTLSKHTYGFFNKAAVYEEQAWREGSENWTLWQRIKSCLSFGAIHMENLFYPLATILPLAIGGGVFMSAYLATFKRTGSRRASVLTSAIWHRVYNRIALVAVAVMLLVWFGIAAFGMIATYAAILISGAVWDSVSVQRELQYALQPAAVE